MNSEYTKLSFPLQPIPFQKGQQVPKKNSAGTAPLGFFLRARFL